jgi:hypothetical protein
VVISFTSSSEMQPGVTIKAYYSFYRMVFIYTKTLFRINVKSCFIHIFQNLYIIALIFNELLGNPKRKKFKQISNSWLLSTLVKCWGKNMAWGWSYQIFFTNNDLNHSKQMKFGIVNETKLVATTWVAQPVWKGSLQSVFVVFSQCPDLIQNK